MTLLAFRDVAVMRSGRLLCEGVSFAIAPGGALAVTGPNGAGKSSLLRVAAGLLDPAAGEVDRPARQALLAEAEALDSEATLAAALGFWARLDGTRDRVGEALLAVGLTPLAEVPVRLLSTGQRRRAAIARVVAGAALLWLLDEPANGLDAASIATLETLIARHRAGGGGVVIASHLPVAMPGAGRLALTAGAIAA